jgi:hypothetical protein
MSTATLIKTTQSEYAPYWENDQTANPVIVRKDSASVTENYYNVVLPSGEVREVHLHTLGRFRKGF